MPDGDRNGFTFFKSYHDAARELPDDLRLTFYDAVIEYGITGTEPELDGIVKAMFILIKPILDRNKAKSDSGSKGGKATRKQTGSESEANTKQTGSNPEANAKQTVTDKDKDKDKEEDKERDTEKDKETPPLPPQGETGGGDPPSPDEEAEDRNDGDMPGGKVEDDEGASPAHAPPPCPHEEIVALYHEILPELPRVREWGKASRSHLNARWRERSDRQNLGWWRDYFEFIRSMDWLMGRVPSKDRRDPFRADLLWLSGAQNMDKVLSGRYVRGQPPRASPGRDEPKPRTYEEAKALEHRAIIDAEFRQIGGDSS